MRIIIVTGEEENGTGLAGITRSVLREHGHEVELFVATSGGHYANSKVSKVRRMFGIDGDTDRLRRLINLRRPEVVHVIDRRPGASAALAMAAHDARVYTLLSLSDFSALCPAGACRTPSGLICEECVHKRRKIMVYNCIGSPIDSLLATIGHFYWDAERLSKCADLFVASSSFMRSKLLEGGFPAKGVRVVTEPVEWEADEVCASEERDDYFCFLSPLTPESGAETAAKGAMAAGVKMLFLADGPLRERLEQLAARDKNIVLVAESDARECRRLLRGAKGAVVSSETYLGGSRHIKESLCAGTPVIASAIADHPEMVTGAEGIVFTPGHVEELATILRDFDKRHAFLHDEIARRAQKKYSKSTYYKNLISLYGH